MLNGPGFESRHCEEIFLFPKKKNIDTLAGPTEPPVQRVPGFSAGVKRPGREVDHCPLFTSVRRLRMSGAILLFPLNAFKTCTRTTLPLLSVVLDDELCTLNEKQWPSQVDATLLLLVTKASCLNLRIGEYVQTFQQTIST